jgi:sulfide dehydrogenase cytochrome subunit
MPSPRHACASLLGAALTALCLGPAAAQTAPALLAAEGCIGCHGPQGAGMGPIAPLAGRDQAELVAAMLAFRANERPGTIMGRVARGYTDAEIAAIAAHFARLGR